MNTDKPVVEDPYMEPEVEVVAEPTKRPYHFPDTDPKTSEAVAKVYHFRWPDYSSWAIFSVCNATGEFSIQSDWGSFSHRWNIDALGGGRTLTEFLASCSGPDYVMNKLCYDRPDLKDEFDEEGTRKLWQKMLWERMDGVTFGKPEADEISDLMERFFDDCRDGDIHGADIALWTMSSELNEFFYQEPWEHIVRRPPWKVTICKNELLPRFFQYLRDHVVQKKKKATKRQVVAVFCWENFEETKEFDSEELARGFCEGLSNKGKQGWSGYLLPQDLEELKEDEPALYEQVKDEVA